jgi:hypothetical protein
LIKALRRVRQEDQEFKGDPVSKTNNMAEDVAQLVMGLPSKCEA